MLHTNAFYRITPMSEIDDRKRPLNLYEDGIISAQKLFEITNIHGSTVHDNLKSFCVRDAVSGIWSKEDLDVNNSRRAAQITASYPQWSAQGIDNECARKGSTLAPK
jgi:hypothetical protein